jgi:hypothetical protein
MKNYLLIKKPLFKSKEYIFIIITATILLLISFSKSFSEENIFTVDNVKVEGKIDLNFSRDKFINKAFSKSFEELMAKIILSSDLEKMKNIRLDKIKNLINSFQIVEEKFQAEEYKAIFKISYNDKKVKNFLNKKNISFSQPKEISAVFFPVLFLNDDFQYFENNYFYNNWTSVKIKNEVINFILPLEDIDNISKIKEMRNRIEDLDVGNFVQQYNISNYIFALMNYDNNKLNVHIKTNFNNDKISKNISYDLLDINDKNKLNSILKDLKMQVTDIWKEANIVNLLMPLSIRVKFKQKNINDLTKLKNCFYKINIIDNFELEEFNINHSIFKIYYFGNPKRLSNELSKFNYKLRDDPGYWEIYIDD